MCKTALFTQCLFNICWSNASRWFGLWKQSTQQWRLMSAKAPNSSSTTLTKVNESIKDFQHKINYYIPISTGTVDRHKYILLWAVGDWLFCSLLFLIAFVSTVRQSNWHVMTSSRLDEHFVAISLSNVWTQKLNLSATGIPKNIEEEILKCKMSLK